MELFNRRRPDIRISSRTQQISAVIATRDFLLRMTDPKTMAVRDNAREIRREARALLRHYPPTDQLRPALERGFAEDIN